MLDIFNYILEHIESLAKLVAYIAVTFVFFNGFLRSIYFNYRFKAPKRVLKLIMYLRKYDKYLSSDDKEYIKYCVNDCIMRDAAKISSAFNKKELFYIFNKLEKKSYINQLYKLQNNIEKKDGHFFIKAKFTDVAFIVSRLMALLMGLLFFIFVMLGFVAIFENKGGLTLMVILGMTLLIEFCGLWIFSTFPTQKTIKNINIELAKFQAPD